MVGKGTMFEGSESEEGLHPELVMHPEQSGTDHITLEK